MIPYYTFLWYQKTINMSSQINAVTKDPERKLNKKIRQAETKGDSVKVKELQNKLSNFLKREEINAKNKEAKKKKKEQKQKMDKLTDYELMNLFQKDNKKMFKDKDELEKKKKENKMKSIEKQVRRAKILQAKKEKEEQEQVNMIQYKLYMDEYKKKEKELDKRLEEHESIMKVEKSEELQKMYDKIMKEINNKKLVNKTYKKQIKQQSMMIEVAIHGYMDQNGVPYEEAQEFIYNNIRKQNDSKKEECKPRTLMIDGIAKL